VSARLALRAPAKLNLTLAVRGRRADGYHELDSVFLAVELADRLEAARAGETCRLRVQGPAAAGVPADGTNLALRAANAVQALARARGLPAPGVELVLEKHVPAEAGLGGGSSDAAAAALACAELYGLDPDDAELRTALAGLGSDCAFFLAARGSGLARCTGRGERVTPLPRLELAGVLALLTPAFGCGTARVYAELDAGAARATGHGRRDPWPFDGGAGVPGSLEALRSALFNELEPAAERSHPELAAFRARLEELAPGAFRLAGSGSSCFGFFEDERAARDLLARLALDEGGRRYALRGQWILPVRSRGLARL
jgi:4-diphosphocytidyl-2-C-methyl-D-erythritol kinase